MDSRESLAQPPSLQRHQTHHHHQLPPSMMMPPNSYTSAHHHHLPNNSTANNNNNIMGSSDSMQQRFSFDASEQYGGGGSSPPGGFRGGGFSIEPARKKRGRPRKYSPSADGGIALGLAPAPVVAVSSAAAAAAGHLESPNEGGSGGGSGTPGTEPPAKKHRGRPPGSGKKQMDALGAPGVGFTPHVITVKAGEDIASKIMAFSQQGPRTVCILSANGAVSNVTLRQPAMSGGTVTYEGRFEIISLSGSFLLTDSNGNRNKSSGLSVSLAGSDGRVLGGGVAGMLVAATPIQVIVGSFITDSKKPKTSSVPAAPPNMVNFGGGSVPGASPPSEGPSSESSDESGGNSPPHRLPGSYNASQQQPPMQNLPLYSNMGWPNSTMNMLPN